jgi:hypothetical protein
MMEDERTLNNRIREETLRNKNDTINKKEEELKEIRNSIKNERSLNNRIREEALRNKKKRLKKVIESIKELEILKKQLEEEIKNVS